MSSVYYVCVLRGGGGGGGDVSKQLSRRSPYKAIKQVSWGGGGGGGVNLSRDKLLKILYVQWG